MDVLFFAFANNLDHPLPNLRREADELDSILSPGQEREDYTIVFYPYVTRQKLVDKLILYKDRLKLFHYSGHAGHDVLQTNEEASQAEGIAHLLGQCPNLEFVFLNGCSTYGQVEDLWKYEVPAILATHSPVEDKKAAQFAIQFYKSLSTQKDLRESFESAKGAVHSLPDAPTIRMYRDVVISFSEPKVSNWGLFLQPSLESVLNWKLPEANTRIEKEEFNFQDNQAYLDILDEIELLEVALERYKGDESALDKILRYDKKLSEAKKKKEAYIAQVRKLYATFSKIEINTERLKRAKAYFDAGEYEKANLILNREEMDYDQELLLAARDRDERKLNETIDLLKKSANEYIIKAQLPVVFKDAKYLADTIANYEQSIKSYSFYENNFEFANFLLDNSVQLHLQGEESEVQKAELLYLEALKDQEADKERRAAIFHNLGLYYFSEQNFKKAKRYCKKAVLIRRELAKENQSTEYLLKLAHALDTIGGILKDKHKGPRALPFLKKALPYFKEALSILKSHEFENEEKALYTEVSVLNNLGSLYQDLENFEQALTYYQSSLEVCDQLVAQDREKYLHDQARIQHNLGTLQYALKNTEEALKAYWFALSEYEVLAQKEPYAHTDDLGCVHIDLGILFFEQERDREKSLSFTREGMRLIKPLLEDMEDLQQYYEFGEFIIKSLNVAA